MGRVCRFKKTSHALHKPSATFSPVLLFHKWTVVKLKGMSPPHRERVCMCGFKVSRLQTPLVLARVRGSRERADVWI